MPRRFQGRLLLACGLALLFATPSRGEEAARPNIILCMADDLGWGDVGFQGNRIVQTPHLDEMARAGLTFNRFYAAAPLCSPTRGSCLTGRHPYRYGVLSANVGHMPARELTLAELLREQGYATGHFGKWHLGTLTKTVRESNRGGPRGAAHYSPPWENGFDVCFSTEAKTPTWDPMLAPARGSITTWWDPVREDQAQAYGTHYWSNGEIVRENLAGDDSRIIVDRVVPFIEAEARRGRPFFAVVWFHAPHLPVVAGPEYTRRYAEHDKYTQHYYGCITALDEQMGRIRKTLRDCGAAENTLLFFCSDNGPEGQAGRAPGSAGPLRGRKRSLYEGGVRVPGLAEWPARIRPGSQTDYPASTLDYLPTVIDLLGLSEVATRVPLDGESLLPLFDGKVSERPRPLGFESHGQVAWMDNRYKLVGTAVGEAERQAEVQNVELYDLHADPGETRNIAAEHPQIVQRLTEQLTEWRKSCRTSWIEGRSGDTGR